MASIEKRIRNGETTWRAHYRTPAGAQRNRSFARKLDAERFLASVENAKLTGTYVDPALAQVTVGEWADRWLAGQAHLKPSTHSRYAGILRSHVVPRWGRVRLGGVSHADVQSWITSLASDLSPASVQKVHRVLSLILDLAVKDGRLVRNVATGVNLPRVVKPRAPLPRPTSSSRHLAHECGNPSDPSKHAAYDDPHQPDLPARRAVPRLHRRALRRDGRACGSSGSTSCADGRSRWPKSVTAVHRDGVLVWGTPKGPARDVGSALRGSSPKPSSPQATSWGRHAVISCSPRRTDRCYV